MLQEELGISAFGKVKIKRGQTQILL